MSRSRRRKKSVIRSCSKSTRPLSSAWSITRSSVRLAILEPSKRERRALEMPLALSATSTNICRARMLSGST